MLKPNGLDKLHLSLADDLIKGNITVNEYIDQRGLSSKVLLNEVKFLVSNPINYNLYLYNLTIGGRCLAMKQVLNLTNRQIAEIVGFSKTTVGDFISLNIKNEQNTNIQSRNFSITLIYRLAIMLDIPIRYLSLSRLTYKMDNIFDEYESDEIRKIDFSELITLALSLFQNKQRNIFGVKIINDFFDYENKYLYSRVDIRERWFSIEVHILNQSSINYKEILKLKSYLTEDCEIYICDAFLRSNKKINIIFPLKDDLSEIVQRHSNLGKKLW